MPSTLTRPEVFIASSNRSKCYACKESIALGAQRVCMPARSSGLTVTKWVHPACFARCICVDLAPTGRASCKGDGTSIEKGTPRVLMRLYTDDGDVKGGSQCIYKPHNATDLLSRLEGVSIDPATVQGVAELESAEHRAYVLKALAPLRGGSAQAAPARPEKESRPDTKAGTKRKARTGGESAAPGDDDAPSPVRGAAKRAGKIKSADKPVARGKRSRFLKETETPAPRRARPKRAAGAAAVKKARAAAIMDDAGSDDGDALSEYQPSESEEDYVEEDAEYAPNARDPDEAVGFELCD